MTIEATKIGTPDLGPIDLTAFPSITALPQKLHFGTNVDISGCASLQLIPDGTKCDEDLIARKCESLVGIGNEIRINGLLDIRDSNRFVSQAAHYSQVVEETGINYYPVLTGISGVVWPGSTEPTPGGALGPETPPPSSKIELIELDLFQPLLPQLRAKLKHASDFATRIKVEFKGQGGLDYGGLLRKTLLKALDEAFGEIPFELSDENVEGAAPKSPVVPNNLFRSADLDTTNPDEAWKAGDLPGNCNIAQPYTQQALEDLMFVGHLTGRAIEEKLALPRALDFSYLQRLEETSTKPPTADEECATWMKAFHPQSFKSLQLLDQALEELDPFDPEDSLDIYFASPIDEDIRLTPDISPDTEVTFENIDQFKCAQARFYAHHTYHPLHAFTYGLRIALGPDSFRKLVELGKSEDVSKHEELAKMVNGENLPLEIEEWQQYLDFPQTRPNAYLPGSMTKKLAKTVEQSFWTAVGNLSYAQRLRFFQLTTEFPQLPPGGFKKLPRRMQARVGVDTAANITAATCSFVISLPPITDPSAMKEKLLFFNEWSGGFGFA